MAGMGSLYVGVSGLQSSQNALNTTAHNLANVDTKGYVRQQILFGNLNYNNIGNAAISSKQVGLGVTIEAVRQVRDYFLDKAYRTEIGRQSFYETGYSTIEEVETLFGELEGVAFQNSMEELQKSIQELAKTPDSTVARSLLKQKSVAFIERASSVYEGLKNYQENLNLRVSGKIDRINVLGQTISELNNQILKNEAGGVESANDLRDLRNNALDELGSLIYIDYNEGADGIVTIRAEGQPFLTENLLFPMGKTTDKITGFVTPIWPHLENQQVFDFGRGISTSGDNDIGELKSLLLSRGDKATNYKDIPVKPDVKNYASPTDANYLNDMAVYKKNVEYYNTYTNPSILMNVMAEFDQLVHGIITSVNDILCPNTTVTDIYGNTYKVLDEDNASYGSNPARTQGTELFSREGVERYTLRTLIMPDGTSKDCYVYNEEDPNDPTTLYSVSNLEVNPAVLKDTSLIALTKKDGSVDYQRAQALEDAWTKSFAVLNPNNLVSYDFGDYYKSLIGSIASEGDIYFSMSKAEATTTMGLDNKRQAVMGVASDEELTNMVKFQNAYNASSRYINVVSEMLEHIIMTLGR